ncbi:MAG: glycyl-radical enzyme activating protein [Treponema sp.]|nr:glycyl-radical enzyme activating protein [Treponema sp.]
MTGTIFDIRRFSVHDGKGIRTTVFLKGCPLRCRWCQNPEGIEPTRRPHWVKSCCLHCNACVNALPPEPKSNRALRWERGRLALKSAALSPSGWDSVMDACPVKALVWDSVVMTAEELMAELEKDRVFFDNSGGVTFSGGEPLAQGDFLLEAMEMCRRAAIHCAIETSLFSEPRLVDKAAALADHIFADYKIADSEQHRAATGQPNDLVTKNLARLLKAHASKITVRTPLIPEFTAVRNNIAAIARFIGCSGVEYELLNYNPLAAAKYPLEDDQLRDYCFSKNRKAFTGEEMEAFRNIARENGVLRIVTS